MSTLATRGSSRLAAVEALRDATLAGRELLARSFKDGENVQHHQMCEVRTALSAAMRAARDAGNEISPRAYGLRNPDEWLRSRIRREELRRKPVAAATEIDDLGEQATILQSELSQRTSTLSIDVTSNDFGVGYAMNVPESLSLSQLRAIVESAETRRDDQLSYVRNELNKRLEPREELEFLLSIRSQVDDAAATQLYDRDDLSHMTEDAREKLLQMLGSSRGRTSLLGENDRAPVDVDELPPLLDVAERFAHEFMPAGFVGYDDHQAAYDNAIAEGREAEAEHEAWDLYDERVEEHIVLKKAIVDAYERVAKASVAYDEGEGERARRVERVNAGLPADLPWERPNKHDCPLTMDRMLDPVIAGDGITYERSAIVEWFLKKRLSSPVTRRDLESDDLIPNYALKTLIRDWLKDEHDKVMKMARMAKEAAPAAQEAAPAAAATEDRTRSRRKRGR